MHIIGDGGHAKVVRDVLRLTTFDRLGDQWHFVAVGNNADRKEEAEAQDGHFVTLIHPSVIRAEYCDIGGGTIIMAGVIIQPGCTIGKHVILNTGCTIDHDCEIGDFAHIAPGAHLCGGVKVGEGALVGVGVGVGPGSVIPPWTVCKAAKLDIQEAG